MSKADPELHPYFRPETWDPTQVEKATALDLQITISDQIEDLLTEQRETNRLLGELVGIFQSMRVG